MNQIKETLQKLIQMSQSEALFSSIDKDLMLQYTRELYDSILQMPLASIQTEEVYDTNTDALGQEWIESFPPAPVDQPEDSAAEEEVVEEDVAPASKENDSEIENPDHSLSDAPAQEPTIPPMTSDAELQTESLPEITAEYIAASTKPLQSEFKVWNRDIKKYIGINDKYNFISELFGNNAEAYEEILNEINLCENKITALMFLENSGITTLYAWKDDGFSEQIFYNVLNQFFSSK